MINKLLNSAIFIIATAMAVNTPATTPSHGPPGHANSLIKLASDHKECVGNARAAEKSKAEPNVHAVDARDCDDTNDALEAMIPSDVLSVLEAAKSRPRD